MNMELRLAKAAELSVISDLARQIWPHTFAEILNSEQVENMLSKIYSNENLLSEMNEGHVFWIASLDAKDIGYASAYTEGDMIRLKKLYLLPEAQGSGCGKAMVNAVLEYFNEAKSISLLVHQENKAAIKFYEHMGFAVTGKEPVNMGDHHFIDALMTKLL